MPSMGDVGNLAEVAGEPSMMHLSKLEESVLETMSLQAGNDRGALHAQIATATVQSPDNTGVGFYTKLKPDPSAQPIHARTIGNVFANIDSLKNPMTFVLFIKDGLVDLLEGATTEEITGDIDFANVKFHLL